MLVKFVVMWTVALVARSPSVEAQRVAVALAQGGEFAFVLFAAAAAIGILEASMREWLDLIVTVSMVLAAPVMLLHERLLALWTARAISADYDRIDAPATPVIIAGYGRFGQIVSRVLRMCDIPFTALEANYGQVDFVRRYGNRIYYGDASRPELLHAAKVGEARLFVLAIDDVEASMKTATLVRRHYPDLEILARARNRVHYFRLRDLGVRAIYRDTFPASLEAAHQALLRLDFGVAAAHRAVEPVPRARPRSARCAICDPSGRSPARPDDPAGGRAVARAVRSRPGAPPPGVPGADSRRRLLCLIPLDSIKSATQYLQE